MYCVVEFFKCKTIAVVCGNWFTGTEGPIVAGPNKLSLLWPKCMKYASKRVPALQAHEPPKAGSRLCEVVVLKTAGNVYTIINQLTDTLHDAFKFEKKIIEGKSVSTDATSECVELDIDTPKRKR